jgi:antitoxin HicB
MSTAIKTANRTQGGAAGQDAALDSLVARYMRLGYAIELTEEDGQWTANLPDLKGCVSFGDSPTEAVAELREVQELWLRGQIESGNPIPEPFASEVAFSGKFLVRITKSLHKQLHQEANAQGVSLNHYVATTLAQRHQRGVSPPDYQAMIQAALNSLSGLHVAKRMYGDRRNHYWKTYPAPHFGDSVDALRVFVQPDSITCVDRTGFPSKQAYLEAHHAI